MGKILLILISLLAGNLSFADAFCHSVEEYISQERKCIPPQNKGRDYVVPVQKQDMYGAIAVDVESGSSGGSFRALTESRAIDGAMKICKENATKKFGKKKIINCAIVASFKNACGSVASVNGRGREMSIWAVGVSEKSKQVALDKALEVCDQKALKANIKEPEPCGLWFGLCSL